MENTTQTSKLIHFKQGLIAVTPLSVAVIPWGILAGSFAIDAGLNNLEALAMSAILFAGAAQIVACGMFKAGLGLGTMLLTTLFITSRHFLYALYMRQHLSPLPFRWRFILGFWLTDELFALCSVGKGEFNRWFALGAGTLFYLVWNVANMLGIVMGNQLPELNAWGLEFTIAATFIALLVPQLISPSMLIAALVALISAVTFTLYQLSGTLLFAALLGMFAGYSAERLGCDRLSLMRNEKNKENA